MKTNFILLFLFTSFLHQAAAQDLPEKQAASNQSSSKAITPLSTPTDQVQVVKMYENQMAEEFLLYQGRAYIGFDHRINGHAYFLSQEWSPASVFYEGILYEDVPLLFDIVNEEVVVLHPNGHAKIKIIKDRLSCFSFAGHMFIRLEEAEDDRNSAPEAGIYEKLYEGGLLVLAKKRKMLSEFTSGGELIKRFKEQEQFYIKKEGTYYGIKNRRAALKVMGEKKKELRRFLRTNKIKYRRNPKTAIVKMAEFYESKEK